MPIEKSRISEHACGADEEAEGVLDGSSLVLVGGYDDEAKKSAAISQRILSFFSKQRNAFNLELCCLGHFFVPNHDDCCLIKSPFLACPKAWMILQN